MVQMGLYWTRSRFWSRLRRVSRYQTRTHSQVPPLPSTALVRSSQAEIGINLHNLQQPLTSFLILISFQIPELPTGVGAAQGGGFHLQPGEGGRDRTPSNQAYFSRHATTIS